VKTFFGFLPAGGWALAIMVLSALSGLRPPQIRIGVIGPDKLAHFGVYLILALLLWFGFYVSGRNKKWENGLILGGGSLYGIGMEWMQYAFFPDRAFEYWDIFANICGISAGWLAGYLYSK
jgi:VanZ family protein